jgi:hypothetical protein
MQSFAGESFKQSVDEFIKLEGEYPHAQMQISGYRKQTTRMIKIHCEDCGMIARTSRKWIDMGRIPYCACNDIQFTVTF